MKKLLLDTHVLLWAIGKSEELSSEITELLYNRDNEVYVSAVSLWEIALKNNVGKLELNFALEDIPMYCQQMDFDLIPLTPFEALGFLKLPKKEKLILFPVHCFMKK